LSVNQEELMRFEQHWHNQIPSVRVFEVPEAVKRKLIRYAPPRKPIWKIDDEFNQRPLTKQERERLNIPESETEPEVPEDPSPAIFLDEETVARERALFKQIANIHQDPGCLSACLSSIPIQPWPHQIKILKRAAAEFPRSFLIADEVGLGKTIETGLILRYLLVSKKVKRVLVLTPASVQPQWHEELREKFNLHFWSYTQGEFKDPYGQTLQPSSNPWNTKDLILASSHLVRRQGTDARAAGGRTLGSGGAG
jgi:SNF2 family DNA or RNA helicase